LGLVVTLFAIGIIFYLKGSAKRGFRWIISAFAIFVVLSYPPVAHRLICHLENTPPMESNISKSIKYVHILGHGHYDDMQLPVSSRLFEGGMKRVVEGAVLYHKYPHLKLVVTGSIGIFDKYPYTASAVELLQSLGVPKEAIVSTIKTKDTKEEAKFIKSIVGKNRYILITSASHMPRALEIMKKEKLNPIADTTDYHCTHTKINLFVPPSLQALELSNKAIHEYLGRAWEGLKSKIVNF